MAGPEPKLVVLDESHQGKHHPILSVGGLVLDQAKILDAEAIWREAKIDVGLDPDQAVKFSSSWVDPTQRLELFCHIGKLPISGVVALLEDFRPLMMRVRKETRTDAYIQTSAFEYVLQRLVGLQYVAKGGGPHVVAFDRRSDPERLRKVYAEHYRTGWRFGTRQTPSLLEHGFAETILTSDTGPLHEIADFLVSGLTGWAAARCAVLKGGTVSDLPERDKMCRAVVGLLPCRGIPPSWLGWSVIAYKGEITGKELIAGHIDRWLSDLSNPKSAPTRN